MYWHTCFTVWVSHETRWLWDHLWTNCSLLWLPWFRVWFKFQLITTILKKISPRSWPFPNALRNLIALPRAAAKTFLSHILAEQSGAACLSGEVNQTREIVNVIDPDWLKGCSCGAEKDLRCPVMRESDIKKNCSTVASDVNPNHTPLTLPKSTVFFQECIHFLLGGRCFCYCMHPWFKSYQQNLVKFIDGWLNDE